MLQIASLNLGDSKETEAKDTYEVLDFTFFHKVICVGTLRWNKNSLSRRKQCLLKQDDSRNSSYFLLGLRIIRELLQKILFL